MPSLPTVDREGYTLRTNHHKDIVAGADILLFECDFELPVRGGDGRVARRRIDRLDPPVHEIDIPDEGGNEFVCRLLIDLDGASDLLDQAVLHDNKAVGDRHRLELVVRHKDRRDLKPLLELTDLLTHDEPEVRIEIGEGLVEEQNLRFEAESPGKGDTLLLAAGEFVDHPVTEGSQFDHVEEFLDPRGDLVLGPLVDLQTVTDVFRHGHVGEEGVVLETDPGVPEIRGKVVDPLAVEDDVPRTDVGESADQTQECRFAASAGAHERDQFALSGPPAIPLSTPRSSHRTYGCL